MVKVMVIHIYIYIEIRTHTHNYIYIYIYSKTFIQDDSPIFDSYSGFACRVAGVPATAGGQLETELVRREGMWEKHPGKTGGINHKNGDVIPFNWHRIGQH